MIASTFNKNIYKISINDNNTSLKSLISEIDSIYDNSILLIEDIDKLFNYNSNENQNIMSDFLNLLDGLDSVYNCITFITTNNYDLLKSNFSPEFFRPGRIDVIKKVGYLSESEIIDYFKYFFSIDQRIEYLNENSESINLDYDKLKSEENIDQHLIKNVNCFNQLIYNFVIFLYFTRKNNRKLDIPCSDVKKFIDNKTINEIYVHLLNMDKDRLIDIILHALGYHLAKNIENNNKVTFAELQNYLLFFKENPFIAISYKNMANFRNNEANLCNYNVKNLVKKTIINEKKTKSVLKYNAKEGDIIDGYDILMLIVKNIFNYFIYIYKILFNLVVKLYPK